MSSRLCEMFASVIRSPRRAGALLAFALLACAMANRGGGSLAESTALAQTPEWLTGPAFRKQLDLPAGLTWPDNPLRPSLTRWGREQRVAVWLDRRVDPDQRVKFSVSDVSLDAALKSLALHLKLDLGYVGPVAYLGPSATARKLATVAHLRASEAAALPAEVKTRLARSRAWRWEELAAPRDLLSELAAEANLTVDNADAMPHDLWAAGDWPPLGLTDRLTLLLAGFDLTFELSADGARLRLVPLPPPQRYEHTYPVRSGLASKAAELRKLFPEAEIDARGTALRVTARHEDHDAITRLLAGEPVRRAKVETGQQRYSLKVENQSVDNLLQALGQRFELQTNIDPRAAALLEKRVSFEVKDATFDELLSAVCKPAGVAYKVENRTIEIRVAE